MGAMSSVQKKLVMEVHYTSSFSDSHIEFVRAARIRAIVCPWEPLEVTLARVENFQWEREISVFCEARKPGRGFCAIRVTKVKRDLTIVNKEKQKLSIARATELAENPVFELFVMFTSGCGCCCYGFSSSCALGYVPRSIPKYQVDEDAKREFLHLTPAGRNSSLGGGSRNSNNSNGFSAPPSTSESLDKICKMFQQGLLTAEEFALAKSRLLNTDSSVTAVTQAYAAVECTAEELSKYPNPEMSKNPVFAEAVVVSTAPSYPPYAVSPLAPASAPRAAAAAPPLVPAPTAPPASTDPEINSYDKLINGDVVKH